MKKVTLIVGVLGCLAWGCSKKKIPDTAIYGLDYYPLAQNRFVVYDVDSVIYTEIPKDTLHYRYRIKEKLADSFTDNEGGQARRLERYIKKYNASLPYDSMPWTMKEVWMVNPSSTSIQVQENNVRYTKLIFPVTAKASWNGNAGNTQGDQTYTYDYIDNKETINNTPLDFVLSVSQRDFRTLISYEKKSEKYARGVGLVYKEIYNLLSNTIVQNVPVEQRIESGLIYKQTLLTYGYE